MNQWLKKSGTDKETARRDFLPYIDALSVIEFERVDGQKHCLKRAKMVQ